MMIDPTRVSPDASLLSKKVVGKEVVAAGVELPRESFQATGTAGGDASGAAAAGKAKVKVFPQDPLVGPTEEIELPKEILGSKLSSPRMEIVDRAPVAIADPDGNY